MAKTPTPKPPRMRTVTKAIECLRETDPGCCLTVSGLRRLIKIGTIRAVSLGRRQLVNVDELERYLVEATRSEEKEPEQVPGIRALPEQAYKLPRRAAK